GVELWTVGTLKLERFLTTDQSGVGRLAFSPDGKWIATAGTANQIHLLDPERGEAVGAVHAEMGPLHDVAFAPDGRSLTVVGEGGVKVWDVGPNPATPTLELRTGMRLRHSAAVYFVRYTPDGKFLATSDLGGGLTLWNSATGKPAATLR